MPLRFPYLKSYRLPKSLAVNRDWYEKAWAGVLFPLHIVGLGCVHLLRKRVPQAYLFGLCFVRADHMRWYWDCRELVATRRWLLRLNQEQPQQINSYIRQWQVEWNTFAKLVRQFDQLDLRRLTDQQLYDWYTKLRDAYVAESSLPYLTDAFMSTGAEDWLVELISAELGGQVPAAELPQVISTLTAPTERTFSNAEALDLLRLADHCQRNPAVKRRLLQDKISAALKTLTRLPQLQRLLERLVRNYHWVQNSYYPTKPLTATYFLRQVANHLRTSDIAQTLRQESTRIQRNRLDKQRLFKKLRISRALRQTIALADRFAKWQDTRKSGVFQVNRQFFRVAQEVARRTGLEEFEAYYLTDWELPDALLHKKFNRKRLRQRRKTGCAMVFTPQGMRLLEGNEYRRLDQSIFTGQVEGDRRVGGENLLPLHGVPASPGQASGKVRVILHLADLHRFKSGEILVTNNTTPDFVPAMRKAAAIITEQGGITSHAAIISRELGKPCVIGVKNVTRLLRDGERVGVDSGAGVVKRL